MRNSVDVGEYVDSRTLFDEFVNANDLELFYSSGSLNIYGAKH